MIDISRQNDSEARFKASSMQAVFGTESFNSGLFGNIVMCIEVWDLCRFIYFLEFELF